MDPTKKICPHPRAKEKPQQDSWKGEIAFRSKSHTHQRWSEGSNKTLCAPGPRDPTRGWARPAFECVSISCEGTGQQWPAAGTGAMTEADLGGMAIEPQHKATKQTHHKLENNYTKEVLALLWKFQGPQESSQPGDLADGLRIPGDLTLKASGIWWQNLHRTGETDSWRVHTKPCVHQEPGRKEQ